MRSLKIVNVKFSLKLNNIMYQDVVESTKTMVIKEKSNFIVVFGKYTYTIFKKSKSTSNLHCNVTKVPDLENISHAIDYLHNFYTVLIFLICLSTISPQPPHSMRR